MAIYLTEKEFEDLMIKRKKERFLNKSLKLEKSKQLKPVLSNENTGTKFTNKNDFMEALDNLKYQELTFYVPGEPFGKERPRVYDGVAITPEKTKNYEEFVKFCFLCTAKASNFEPINFGAVGMEINAFFKVPPSYPKWKVILVKLKKLLPTKKPDFDNIVKVVSDSLNELAYLDDSQITDCTIRKRYSLEGEGKLQIKIYSVLPQKAYDLI